MSTRTAVPSCFITASARSLVAARALPPTRSSEARQPATGRRNMRIFYHRARPLTTEMSVSRRPDRPHDRLLLFGLRPFLADLEPQTSEQAHVDVGDPDKREAGDKISAPALVQQGEARGDEDA